MTEYLLFAIIIIQWLFICWIGYGARRERKELIDELVGMKLHTVSHTNMDFAPEITMPHPDTGAELRFQHVGNGQYAPQEQPWENVENNVTEVEGI